MQFPFILMFTQDLRGRHINIGGTDLQENTKWIWHGTGQTLASGYTAWGPGQPDGLPNTNPHCLHLWHQQNYLWGDGGCSDHKYAICEMPAASYGLK